MNSLKQSLNAIREISSTIYHEYVPVIDDTTDISAFAQPILEFPVVYNEFCDVLVNKLVFSQYETMTFNNPLRVLDGDRIPLGFSGENVYTNPAKARGFNVNDFAGILAKYESDTKVQYFQINSDIQYCVTISRQQLKKAMTSWDNLGEFITQLSNSLYNGAYIDFYRYTKNIISGAYKENRGVIETISAVSSADTAKAFVEKARELFLNFQLPSTSYNAWAKNGGAGRPITTWSRPEDIVMVVRNDIRAKLDVEVLASAFNIDKTTLLGNIITVDNFDSYDDDGNKVFDGSAIVGLLADKAWFKIKTQDMFMENFYNPNNRTMQYYLNVIRMYNMSLFANGVIFATSQPVVPATSIEFIEDSASVDEGKKITLHVKTTPFTANPTLTYTSSATTYATVGAQTGKYIEVTGVAAGSSTITVTDGTHSDTLSVTVNATVTPSPTNPE
ncbi:MAG: Ig-like domain-containing protein [Bacilli bacterium]|nr:Ig-like domain-containing protein [Bacilli bacterium]